MPARRDASQPRKKVTARPPKNGWGRPVRTSGRLFWADRIVEKARNWFNRAVKLDPDNGDSWAYFLKFEIEQGTDESRQDVIARAVQAEPRHGLVWPTVAKAVGNGRKTIEEILALTAVALDAA